MGGTTCLFSRKQRRVKGGERQQNHPKAERLRFVFRENRARPSAAAAFCECSWGPGGASVPGALGPVKSLVPGDR